MSIKLAVVPPQQVLPIPPLENANQLSATNLQNWTLDDDKQERLQFLNQEIANLRGELDALEDWDYYESAPLKYQILVYVDERSKMAGDFQRKTERTIRDAAEEAWKVNGSARQPKKVDSIRDEIDWVSAKIRELIRTLLTARPEDRSTIRNLLKAYKTYWEELMTSSGRIRIPKPDQREVEYKKHREETSVPVRGGASKRKTHRRPLERKSRRSRRTPQSRETSHSERPIVLSLKMLSKLTKLATLK